MLTNSGVCYGFEFCFKQMLKPVLRLQIVPKGQQQICMFVLAPGLSSDRVEVCCLLLPPSYSPRNAVVHGLHLCYNKFSFTSNRAGSTSGLPKNSLQPKHNCLFKISPESVFCVMCTWRLLTPAYFFTSLTCKFHIRVTPLNLNFSPQPSTSFVEALARQKKKFKPKIQQQKYQVK